MVLDAVAEVAGVVRVAGHLHAVHVELTLDVTPPGGGGHGQGRQVGHLVVLLLLLGEERRRQSGAGPDINRNWEGEFRSDIIM